MLKFPHSFGFDLPHAFACDFEDPAHLLQRVGVAVAQSVAQPDDLPFPVGEGLEQAFDFFAKQLIGWQIAPDGLWRRLR